MARGGLASPVVPNCCYYTNWSLTLNWYKSLPCDAVPCHCWRKRAPDVYMPVQMHTCFVNKETTHFTWAWVATTVFFFVLCTRSYWSLCTNLEDHCRARSFSLSSLESRAFCTRLTLFQIIFFCSRKPITTTETKERKSSFERSFWEGM